MIDPIDSLAFSLESSKGFYALLVGSGISYSAEIPTGEQITSELIKRLAHLRKENCGQDPHVWYKQNYGEVPEYSILLCQLAKTQNDRFNLLKEFFEPSEEERQRGAKSPTRAHKAIAQLVLRGYVKIIITTNFDRLIENALEDVKITPTIISTSDMAENAIPIVHANCTIIKVNGDYLDPRIRNAYSELESYDDATNRLLDRILDEFGLIVCGWSAEWDIALRRAFERCKNHRFSTYWTDIREPNEKAKTLIGHRRANFIRIRDADTFFCELAEKVIAIDSFRKPNPISKQVAIARVKKYLVADLYKIQLYDLIMDEIDRLKDNLREEYSSSKDIRCYADIERRMHRIEYFTEIVLAMMITGCYWGSEHHNTLWTKCIERVANLSVKRTQEQWLIRYPAFLLFYGGGIAALANNQYDTFAQLLLRPNILTDKGESPAIDALITNEVLESENASQLFSNHNFNKYTPFSNYIFEFLKDPLKIFLPEEIQYKKCFDRFEYLTSLEHSYLRRKLNKEVWGPIGCFGWRYRRLKDRGLRKDIEKEAIEAGNDWRLLKAGLFDGEIEEFLSIKNDFDKFVDKCSDGWI